MEFLEKDLEEVIFNSDKGELSQRGLYLECGKLFRQFRIGNYGIADLVHAYFEYDCVFNDEGDPIGYRKSKLYINVIELKKDKIGISAFLQAVNYLKGIKRYFEKKNYSMDVDYKITLIGKSIDTSGSFCYLPDVMDCLELYVYRYDFDGVYFDEQRKYKLTDEGF